MREGIEPRNSTCSILLLQGERKPMSRFVAFISYSHADHVAARWLHRKLEHYRLPRALAGTASPFGPVPRRLPPVFRDREELPASGDLGAELRAALAESRFQIVLCSPRSAASKWVNEEILSFKRIHGEGRTLALIVGGEPYAGGDLECFPLALRFQLAADGSLSDVPAEPIAADIRPGKDGRRLAALKLIAGVTGLKLDALARRDALRRQRWLAAVAGASLALAAFTGGLAIYAEIQRREADSQRRIADSSLDFLVSTFSIANPATENPRTITALTILDRVSKRAGTEFRNQPAVGARLLRTTGNIYFNLGLPRESERDLRAALALEPRQSEGRARDLLKLAALATQRGDAAASLRAIDGAVASYDPGTTDAPMLDAQVVEQRAMVNILTGHYAAAAAGLGDAAGRYQRLKGDYRQDIGRVWANQAQSLMRVHRRAQADQLFAASTAIYTAKFGTNHVMTADVIRNRAVADFETGHLDEAQHRIDQALAIYNRVLEGDHPTIADAMILTGRIKTARGDAAGALAAFAKAHGIFQRLFGANSTAVGDVNFYAAEAQSRRGNTPAALELTELTKSIYDKNYGPDDPDQIELLMLRSRVLAAAHRYREARRECLAGAALKKKIAPADPELATMGRDCAAIGAVRDTAVWAK